MLRAGRHSYYVGTPLNWQAVIDFGLIEPSRETRPYRDFQNIRKRLWSWWDHKRKLGLVKGPFLDWVTWESPKTQTHANWLIYAPEELLPELERVICDRCRKVMGALDPDTVHQQWIWNLNGAMFYMLEGTEPDYAEKIKIRPKEQGEVWFRRAYPSRALGKAARERDWQEGNVVEQPTRGIPKPRELREIIRLGLPRPRKAS